MLGETAAARFGLREYLMVKPLWLPDAETARNSNLAKFIEFIGAARGLTHL